MDSYSWWLSLIVILAIFSPLLKGHNLQLIRYTFPSVKVLNAIESAREEV